MCVCVSVRVCVLLYLFTFKVTPCYGVAAAPSLIQPPYSFASPQLSITDVDTIATTLNKTLPTLPDLSQVSSVSRRGHSSFE